MPLVKLVDEETATPEIKELFLDARRLVAPVINNVKLEKIKLTAFSRAMANVPAFLRSHTHEYSYVMAKGTLPKITKEILAFTVSMTNGCPYCATSHASLVRYLGLGDQEIAELASVVGHISGLNAFEHGCLMDAHGVQEIFAVESPDDAPLLEEIEQTLGFLPNYYKVMARDPKFLECIWEREQATMLSGKIDRITKELVAYSTSATNRAQYSVAVHIRILKQLGLTDRQLFEALQVTNTLNRSNKFSEGLRIEGEDH